MRLRTGDGLELAAWYVSSRNDAAVIFDPTRTGAVAQARMLVRHGYGVLLLEARGYDGSEGDPNVFGWGGTSDVDAAVAWLARRSDVTRGRIGGIGFSVGGEVMLQAAASNAGLRAVVSEGADVRSVREHLCELANSRSGRIRDPLRPVTERVERALVERDEPAAVHQGRQLSQTTTIRRRASWSWASRVASLSASFAFSDPSTPITMVFIAGSTPIRREPVGAASSAVARRPTPSEGSSAHRRRRERGA
jgi:fermentation-respiration switch protein FrsA (DUF1100 family)